VILNAAKVPWSRTHLHLEGALAVVQEQHAQPERRLLGGAPPGPPVRVPHPSGGTGRHVRHAEGVRRVRGEPRRLHALLLLLLFLLTIIFLLLSGDLQLERETLNAPQHSFWTRHHTAEQYGF